MRTLAIWIVVACVAVACAAPSQRPKTTVTLELAKSPLRPQPSNKKICPTFADETRSVRTRAEEKYDHDHHHDWALLLRELPPALGDCAPTAGGAWGLVLKDLDLLDPNNDLSQATARWVIAYATKDGHRAELMPELHDPSVNLGDAGPHDCCDLGIFKMEAPAPVAFDYDSDGRDEYVVAFHYLETSMYDDQRFGWGRVLTFKNGKIEEYGPAKEIDVVQIRDDNDDGRPDLVSVSQRMVSPDPDCDEECAPEYDDEPEVVWLSQKDGTFKKRPR